MIEKIFNSNDKIFDPMVGFIVSYVSSFITNIYYSEDKLPEVLDYSELIFLSLPNASNKTVILDAQDIMIKLSLGEYPTEIKLFIKSLQKMSKGDKQRFSGIKPIHAGLIKSAFIYFYESCINDFKIKYSTNSKQWPSILNFGRVIRNGCAHNGLINFNSEKALSVKWKKLSYSYSDNGKNILFNDMGIADFIVLMIEMNELL